jgi:predicted Zn-dependent protease
MQRFLSYVPLVDTVYPVNPINGRRHVILLPRTVERWIGDHLLYPLATYGMRTVPGKALDTRVQAVFTRLRDANQALLNPSGKTPFNYRIQTVTSSEYNAFATAGGGMVISTGLARGIAGSIAVHEITETTVTFADGSSATVDLKSVTADDVLAALLGHEMTHVASHHSAVKLSLEALFSCLRTACAWSTDKVERLIALFHSRENEYEADATGAYFAHQAGYSPLGALYLQELLQRDNDKSNCFFHKHFEIFYTHPHGDKRRLACFGACQELDAQKMSQVTTWSLAENIYDARHAAPALSYAHAVASAHSLTKR